MNNFRNSRGIGRFISATIILAFVVTCSLSAVAEIPEKGNAQDTLQTAVTSPIPLNTPSEESYLTFVGKLQFVAPSFVAENIADLPGRGINTSAAILSNSFQYNVFYVTLTAKAP